ncbi:hypothetical protein [Aureispira sp. CCB-E]|uniref:hypothetical protein n=1 Tax=Aureispira sp. CCB-E TaxID=3051121 RepID=UPI0028689AC8|nr:hypothetical protein [Aureispira sp. CCB-E]WMX17595.1 hypothetical protein QP953_28340 [Aureispira sp. CCB-E]
MGGQSVAFEFRTQDPRLGRFLSTDPLTAMTPWETPYAFAGNSPIANIDYLGLNREDGKGNDPKKGEPLLDEKGNIILDEKDEPLLAGGDGIASITPKSTDEAVKKQKNVQVFTREEFEKEAMRHHLDLPTDEAAEKYRESLRNAGYSNLADELFKERMIQSMHKTQSEVGWFVVTFPTYFMGMPRESGAANAAEAATTITYAGGMSVSQTIALRSGRYLGSKGWNLGKVGLTDQQMLSLANSQPVEFALVYTMGAGKNGRGGFYTLYSGTQTGVYLGELTKRTIVIGHTHPYGVRLIGSSADHIFMKKLFSLGSPQKFTKIYGHGQTTFQSFSRYIDLKTNKLVTPPQ